MQQCNPKGFLSYYQTASASHHLRLFHPQHTKLTFFATMRAFFVTAFALLTSCNAKAVLQPSSSTPDATITPGPQVELLRKQDGNRFIGWYMPVSESTYTSQSCGAGETMRQRPDTWACCFDDGDDCNPAIDCNDGTITYTITGGSASGSSYSHIW